MTYGLSEWGSSMVYEYAKKYHEAGLSLVNLHPITDGQCECGNPEQTADHVINSCPLYRPPSEAGLEMLAWLHDTKLDL